MAAVKLLNVLHVLGFLTPRAFIRFLSAICRDGVNVMLLLTMGASVYGNQVALVAGAETLTYKQLKLRSETLALALLEKFKLGKGQKTAFLCRNHAALIQSLFAVSRTGAHLYLLNPDMSQRQFDALAAENGFDLLIYDNEFKELVSRSPFENKKLLSYHENLPSADAMARMQLKKTGQLKKASSSRIVLLTGGTTGKPKKAVHSPSLFNFLNPFSEIMAKLRLTQFRTAYIATPIFHGYGIAILFSLLALGKKVVIHERFHAGTACALIKQHKVEVITVVPLMIEKMLKMRPEELGSIKCIASGGAKLNPKLIRKVAGSLGDVLYNLYGTSEGGLNLIATPQDLSYSVSTVGRSITGTHIEVFENGKVKKPGEIGQLCVRNGWSMKNGKAGWIETGDLGFRDAEGYYYLCGRTDDMVVSAGINIYPAEIEQALLSHPLIDDAAVVGIEDEAYGEALKAYIQAAEGSALTQELLVEWLLPRVAKFQIPRAIEFIDHLPYTTIGKLDKKVLRETGKSERVF